MNLLVVPFSILALVFGTFSVMLGGRPLQFVVAGCAYAWLGFYAAAGENPVRVRRQLVVGLLPWLILFLPTVIVQRLDYLYPIVGVGFAGYAAGVYGRSRVLPVQGPRRTAVIASLAGLALLVGGFVLMPIWKDYLGVS